MLRQNIEERWSWMSDQGRRISSLRHILHWITKTNKNKFEKKFKNKIVNAANRQKRKNKNYNTYTYTSTLLRLVHTSDDLGLHSVRNLFCFGFLIRILPGTISLFWSCFFLKINQHLLLSRFFLTSFEQRYSVLWISAAFKTAQCFAELWISPSRQILMLEESIAMLYSNYEHLASDLNKI